MSTCDPSALILAGSCFACRTPWEQRVIRLQLLCEILNAGGGGGGAGATNQWLLEHLPAVQYTSETRDADNVVTTATALWPDGSAGVYTLVTKNVTWLAADAWTLTHTLSGKTLTQAAVTRNGSGYTTTKPAITIV